ncbi:MAG: sodium:calcium antiporter [Planctomycetota bacterium]
MNIVAAVNGNPGLSFGNVIGSNIANIGLVIGVGALIAPLDVHSRIIGREIPWMLGASLGAAALAYLPWTAIATADGASLAGFGRIDGLLMLGSFLLFMTLWFLASRKDSRDPLAAEVEDEARRHKIRSPVAAALVMLMGLVGLLAGGKLTEQGAVEAASALGLSNAIIGMTVVAVATSLPELATVVMAARKHHSDLALGNIVGSNIFNLLLVLALTCIIAPVPLPASGGTQDLIAMLVMSGLLLVVAYTHQRSVNRFEGGLLLALYGGYLIWGVLREVR